MNPQFPRQPPIPVNNIPFFNPQKDVINPNNPALYHNTSSTQIHVNNYNPNPNSKSFITRSSIMEPQKTNNNVSAFIKTSN
jgi:hypothetical protein